MYFLLSKDSPLIPYLLLFLQIACWAEMDLFVPSLPEILRDFGTTESVIQWTFSLNFLGFFLSSLIVGPLADAYGRRKILLGGSFIFAMGAIVSFIAPDIEIFLLGRLIQGLGVGAPAVITFAILGDLYQGEKQIKIMSLINSIITVTMALAPIIGAYIASSLGWRANFGCICLLAILGLLTVCLFVPETLPNNQRHNFSFKDIFLNYKRLILNKSYIFTAIGLCALITPYFVFVSIISLIFIDELGLSMSQYVIYQSAVVGCFSFFSLFMPFITNRTDTQLLNKASIAMSFIAAFLLAMHGLIIADQPFSITFLMCIYATGLVLPCTVMYVAATEAIPELRASASALFQSIRMLMLSLGTSITGMFYNHTYAPIGIITGLLVFIGCIFLLPALWSLTKDSFTKRVVISH